MIRQITVIAMLVTNLLVQGCSTTGGSVATGSATGAGLGAGVGALASSGGSKAQRIRNVVIGAGAGAIVGGAAGYGLHSLIESRVSEASQKGREDAQKHIDVQFQESGEPYLIPPKTEAIFVDDQVRGSIFIPAHFEYRIVTPARWGRRNGN